MSATIIYTIISLSATGAISAVILYFVAQRFKVYEDPRIDLVEDALPAANCGGCGHVSCRNFAEACVKSENLSSLFCTVGGNETMAKVALILGLEAVMQDTKVAVVRCAGSYDKRPRINIYDGPPSCILESSLYPGDTGCPYGCLGHGDCVKACDFDAIHMDLTTGLPVVTDEKCTACNACVVACPKHIIELRKKNKKDRKIFVCCINEEKGVIAKKNCEVACIGCGKCVKVCPYEAITLENYLAYIDPIKCRLCRKCVEVCPTNSIHEINFPPGKSQDGTDATVDVEIVENL
jgi:Na+-translocating ferredoxin:NAD+ oxidoreductase RNF subunit RnfB